MRQWQLPAPLLFAVLLWTKPARWRRGVAAILALGMAVLHYHFVELVHEHGWTGNPNQQRWAAIDRRMVSEAVRRAAYDTDASDTPISAGPLRETPMWELMKQQVRRGSPNRREIGRAWHTWLTGLYPYRVIPQEYWYPGGPPETAAEHIEARDIEEPAATMPKP